jgi:hypothetical protein
MWQSNHKILILRQLKACRLAPQDSPQTRHRERQSEEREMRKTAGYRGPLFVVNQSRNSSFVSIALI